MWDGRSHSRLHFSAINLGGFVTGFLLFNMLKWIAYEECNGCIEVAHMNEFAYSSEESDRDNCFPSMSQSVAAPLVELTAKLVFVLLKYSNFNIFFCA